MCQETALATTAAPLLQRHRARLADRVIVVLGVPPTHVAATGDPMRRFGTWPCALATVDDPDTGRRYRFLARPGDHETALLLLDDCPEVQLLAGRSRRRGCRAGSRGRQDRPAIAAVPQRAVDLAGRVQLRERRRLGRLAAATMAAASERTAFIDGVKLGEFG